MSNSRNPLGVTALILGGAFMGSMLVANAAQRFGFGTPATPQQVAKWSDDVRGTDGKGLPPGHGNVKDGAVLYAAQCAACHGDFGEGAGRYPMLAGGERTLSADRPVQTVGSYWPYAPTLYDYIRRAMPFPAPGSLTDDQTYAITAYVLNLNNLVPESTDLDAAKLAAVKMPNRDGFVDAHLTPDWHAQACMKGCKPTPKITSDLARTIGVTPSLTNDASTLDNDDHPDGAATAKAVGASEAGAAATTPTFSQIAPIVAQRCASCHAAKPTQAGFSSAPMGIELDSPANIHKLAAQIKAQAVSSHQMPIGNLTHMTDKERTLLGQWIAAGAVQP